MLTRTDIVVKYPYPVPSIYAFLFFVRFFRHDLAAYLCFVVLSFLVATCWLSWRVHRLAQGTLPQVAVWSTFLLGFPLLMLLDRGNIEAVVWVFVLLGLAAYARNWTLASAILWSAAASMKIFPCLLFALFLAKRQYRAFAIAVVATIAFSVLALAGVGPTIHQAALDSAQSKPFLVNNYILARSLPQFDHSLFCAVKRGVHSYAAKFARHQERFMVEKTLQLYSLIIPVGCLLLYWFRLRRLPILNQFMAYMLLCVLLPYVSYEYTLVYVYLVWAVFLLFLLEDVAAGRVRVRATAIQTIFLSCAVTFAPLGYFRYGGQVKTVLLLSILLAVLRIPMPSTVFGDLKLPRNGSAVHKSASDFSVG